jgi:hypothetical protein
MKQLFARTNLARCAGDWCTKMLVSQYLVNYRKHLTKSQRDAEHAVNSLPAAAAVEAEYWREAAADSEGMDSDAPDNDDQDAVGDDDEDDLPRGAVVPDSEPEDEDGGEDDV